MKNIFGVRRSDPDSEKISISDLGAEVLLHTLVLAGSALAETDSQRQLIVWLAEHDGHAGNGGIGFYLAEMPWIPMHFEADRRFMVNVVDAASRKTGWEKLPVQPVGVQLMPVLGWMRKHFVRLRPEQLSPDAYTVWLDGMEDDDPVLNGFPQCPRHGIYLTWLGCRICGGRSRSRNDFA